MQDTGISSPKTLEGLIGNSRPIRIKIIAFVTLALVLLSGAHVYESIRLSVSNARRMETMNFLLKVQAIRDHLDSEYAEALAAASGDQERAFGEILAHFKEENYFFSQLQIFQPSLLSFSFGENRRSTASNMPDEDIGGVLDAIAKNDLHNSLETTDFALVIEKLDDFVYTNVGSEQFLIAQAPALVAPAQVVFAQKSITRQVALKSAVQSSMAFAAVVFWLGVWFAIFVASFVGRRIDQSNAAIRAAFRAREEINSELEGIVSERTRELEASKTAAEAANRSKSAFLANMSHEIRTPMNGVLAMAEMMSHSDLTEDQRRQLQTIANSGETLLRILDDILDISKIEAGRLQIEQTGTRIRDLAESISLAMAPEADKRNVRLSLSVAPQVPEELQSDPVRLRQIIYNLLSNAIKFSESADPASPGKVLFRLDYLEGDILEARVADNGIGISPEDSKELFKPFSQAEISTTRRFGGSGLGLSITRNLVDLLGGRIELESELGKGSTFTVSLPSKTLRPKTFEDIGTPVSLCFLLDEATNPDPRPQVQGSVTSREFTNEIDLRAAVAGSEGPVIVAIGLGSMSQNLAARDRLVQSTSCRHFILLASDKSAKRGLAPSGDYIAARFPVLPSEIEKAIADLLSPTGATPAKGTATSTGAGKEQSQAKTGKKVLLVEDNEINIMVLSQQLEILGFTPEVAQDGFEGLEKWKAGDFDLVVTDCHMPRMDGFELTREIRDTERAEGRKPSRIIAITANAMTGEAARCREAGMDGYLSKPATLDQMREVLCPVE